MSDMIEPPPSGSSEPPAAENPFAKYAAPAAPAAENPFGKYAQGAAAPAAQATSTSASGLAASAARGLAPYAVGAGVGAAAGAPFAGVGAVPGAIAGVAATGLTELGGGLYNMLAPSRLPQMLTPKGATDKMMDVFGIRRPASTLERGVESAAPMSLLGAQPARGPRAAGAPPTLALDDMIVSNRAAAAEKAIDRLYSRAIKPSTVGHDTGLQRRSAFSDIVEQKQNLQYTDPDGKVLSQGHLPKTPAQFGEAIDQSKASLFRQWDDLAQTAEGAGARIDVAPVVAKLREKAADPVLLRDDPAAAAYAADLAARYATSGGLLPSEAQRSIAGWNQRLKAFYRNPVEEGAGRAGINGTLASDLRTLLDHSIAESAAPGYQALKNRYGSLRAIEDDVDRATRRISNREPGGGLMGRAANMIAGEEIIRGGLTGNMKTVATGIGVKAFGELVKYLHSPNRAITKMFEKAEKYHKAPAEVGGHVPMIPEPAVPPLALPAPQVQGPAYGWTSTGEGMMPPGSPAFSMQQPAPIVRPNDPLARALGQ